MDCKIEPGGAPMQSFIVVPILAALKIVLVGILLITLLIVALFAGDPSHCRPGQAEGPAATYANCTNQ
jgi:hypothetical protein